MAANDDSALEAQQEVLPDRIDTLEQPAVDGTSNPGDKPSWMRALRLDALSDDWDLTAVRHEVRAEFGAPRPLDPRVAHVVRHLGEIDDIAGVASDVDEGSAASSRARS